MVSGRGRDITDRDMNAAASVEGVSVRRVRTILEQVGEAIAALSALLAEVSGWRRSSSRTAGHRPFASSS